MRGRRPRRCTLWVSIFPATSRFSMQPSDESCTATKVRCGDYAAARWSFELELTRGYLAEELRFFRKKSCWNTSNWRSFNEFHTKFDTWTTFCVLSAHRAIRDNVPLHTHAEYIKFTYSVQFCKHQTSNYTRSAEKLLSQCSREIERYAIQPS